MLEGNDKIAASVDQLYNFLLIALSRGLARDSTPMVSCPRKMFFPLACIVLIFKVFTSTLSDSLHVHHQRSRGKGGKTLSPTNCAQAFKNKVYLHSRVKRNSIPNAWRRRELERTE